MTGKAKRQGFKAGVMGATGHTGVELIRLLEGHPRMDLHYGTSRNVAGRCLSEVDPSGPRLDLITAEEANPAEVDVVFLCLPHGDSAGVVSQVLEQGAPAVVDLSGDMRLRDREAHLRTYASERDEALVREGAYGLPEWGREAIRGARVVANPGCYATAATLALLPLAEAQLLSGPVHVDAKSGVSGAGRSASALTHFCSAHDDVRPYKVGREHRHIPEIEQTLVQAGARKGLALSFVPHLVPMERGILATCAVYGTGLDENAARSLFRERYQSEPFIRVLEGEAYARTRAVAHSNRVVVSVHGVEGQDTLIVAAAIDNLGKGAAGQALQNANLMLGLEETDGLRGF